MKIRETYKGIAELFIQGDDKVVDKYARDWRTFWSEHDSGTKAPVAPTPMGFTPQVVSTPSVVSMNEEDDDDE